MSGYSAVAIPLRGLPSARFLLASARDTQPLDPDAGDFVTLSGGVKARPAAKEDRLPPIEIQADGRILLLEALTYDWKVTGVEGFTLKTQLQSATAGSHWSHREGDSYGSFQVVTYLGTAPFHLEASGGKLSLHFEIISQKFDYFSEYRLLTEEIAGFCQQLLLDLESPTSLAFETDGDRESRLLLEQFLFLRGWLTREKLEGAMESILRNPHTNLEKEHSWTPAAMVSSADWLYRPASMARDWKRNAEGLARPAECLDVRKYDSPDTPPNRFLKFALDGFLEVCRQVGEQFPEAYSLNDEASRFAENLEQILAKPFFRDIGRMTRVPLDNQTVQKRHGYRDILHAWILQQAAASLTWEGNEETFSGPSRNVATLYEYWIFITLHRLLGALPGFAPRDEKLPSPADDPESFLQKGDKGLIINLKRSRRSRTRFIFTPDDPSLQSLAVDLYYERVFRHSQDAVSGDSYSRQFKPDYTLAIYPAEFEEEPEASAANRVAYLHLDAKYRAQQIEALFGNESDEGLDEEKEETKAKSTYKRGDLLKMHTYNDAVRQTIGSYVLYPGSDTGSGDRIRKFHEIVPGVGAYVLKPGNRDCLDALSGFLTEILTHQSNRFSQLSRIRHWTHDTVKEEPAEYIAAPRNLPVDIRPLEDCPASLFYMRSPEVAERCYEKRLVYFHATGNDGAPQKQDPGIFNAEWVVPHMGGESAGWLAKVKFYRLLDKSKLAEHLEIDESGLSVSHYHVFELEQPIETNEIFITDDFSEKALKGRPLPIPLGRVFR